MKKLIILFIALLHFSEAIAQSVSAVDITLVENPIGSGIMEVRVRPNGTFSGVYSSIVFTIRWSSSYNVNLGAISQPSPYSSIIPIAKQGGEIPSGGNIYQKFAGFGFNPMSNFGVTWAAGTEYTIMSIRKNGSGAGYGLFQIVNDSWTNSNNGNHYQELASDDKTGIIYGSGANIPLPVELISFNSSVSENSISINWQSASERNFSGYELQRSTNAHDFSKIAWLPGKGGGEYQHLDTDIRPGITYYYRLKMLDLDGKYEYSPIRTAKLEGSVVRSLSLTPNPAVNHFIAKFETTEFGPATLDFFTESGQLVFAQKFELQSGPNEIMLNTSRFAPGNYVVRLTTVDGLFSDKLVLKK